jgi:hypothetical protein
MVVYDPATGKNHMVVYTVHATGTHNELVGVFKTEPEAHQAVRQAMKARPWARHWYCSKHGSGSDTDNLEGNETEVSWDVEGETIFLRKHTL